MLASGCATTATGFTKTGFVGGHASYTIRYAEPGKFGLLESDWELENYNRDSLGRPETERTQGIYQAKMDWVDDSGESRKVTYVPHDLKFRHNRGSLLLVATVAVPSRFRKLRMSAIAEQWANSYSELSFSFGHATAHRTASKILGNKSRTVDGRPAREVTFDVVNVDQLALDPNAPRTRIRALFIQAPFYKTFVTPSIASPAFLFVGLVSSERDFDDLTDDYDDLLSRFYIAE